MSFDDILNSLFDNSTAKENLTWTEKKKAYFTKLGIMSANNDSKPVAWDKNSEEGIIYLKFVGGRIEKINLNDNTRLTNIGGDWQDRQTLTYTEEGYYE